MNIGELAKCPETLKVYQTMFRTVKESETVDWRQHCFLVQASAAGVCGAAPPGPRYFSAETRQDLLRVEAAWTHNIVNSVIRLGVSYTRAHPHTHTRVAHTRNTLSVLVTVHSVWGQIKNTECHRPYLSRRYRKGRLREQITRDNITTKERKLTINP